MMDQQQQLIDWISHDKNFTEIFNILDRYHLTEATLCAGSIRELVWNKLENKPSSILRNNLDIYYNDPGESYEHYLTIKSVTLTSLLMVQRLKQQLPISLKNAVRSAFHAN